MPSLCPGTGASCPGAALGFALVKIHYFPIGLLLQPVRVPLDDSRALKCIDSHQLVICRLDQHVLCNLFQVTDKVAKRDQSQGGPCGVLATCYWCMTHSPLPSEPSNSDRFSPICFSTDLDNDVLICFREYCEGLLSCAQVEVTDSHCSPSDHKSTHRSLYLMN